MISTSWIEKRKPYWSRLETLLEQTRGQGLKSLTRDELRDLGLLYRQAAADLSALRADSSSVHLARYLNQLLARAHNTIYSGRKARYGAVLDFYWHTYPQVFRERLNYVIVAFILFLGGAVVGSFLTLQDPSFEGKIIGPEMAQTIQRHEMWTHSILAMKPQASSAIMTNNLNVSFTTFAAGITGGLGTIFYLVFNGIMLGVIGTACALAGMSLQLWSFVAPHSVLELPAIFIAGGAGLRLGAGLLFPGVLPRRESVVRGGREAVQLVLGCIPMLFVAGFIEGFVSPTDLPVSLKFLLAVSLLTVLCLYLSGSLTSLSAGSRIKAGSSV